jgi:hypothetical protein
MTRLTLPADDRALIRRERLCAAHPELRVSAGTGFWQAEIPVGRKTHIVTRHELDDVLDRVEAVLTPD